jgi:hypothetical protein
MKTPLVKPTEDNINAYMYKQDKERIELAHDKNQRRYVVKTVMNLVKYQYSESTSCLAAVLKYRWHHICRLSTRQSLKRRTESPSEYPVSSAKCGTYSSKNLNSSKST